MERKDFEIMAPAGSYESLAAAVQGGTDSVYFGAGHLNMRAASSVNFTLSDLKKIADFCREKGKKSYLTLNVTVYDDETSLIREIVDAAAESGIDAVIASDIAVMEYASARGMEIHLSTQLNIANTEALKFYSRWADVVVLARELNLGQVRKIYDSIIPLKINGPSGNPVRIEMFVHGALCMAISGKCYLSLHENNTSANRGECYQTCRKAYIVTEKETGYELLIDNEYIMSPKDLCTIGFIDKIADAGARVFKIEGRARSPEYVKTVTSCYNEALISVIDGTYSEEKIQRWKEKLSTVFNRGFWDGYYLGQKVGEWNTRYGSASTKRKSYIGKITNYFTKSGVAEIKLENDDLSTGDQILIIGPTTGVIEHTVDEVRAGLDKTEKASKGSFCSVKIPVYLRRSDKVYKWIDRD